MRIPDSGRDVPGPGTEKTATQINTAIPMVVWRENYADRLTRWMENERRREQRKAEYRWIPVTERLPDEGTRCLVIGDAGQNKYIGSFAACAVWRRFFGMHFDPSWCFPHVDINVASDLRDGVTHWMPLPSPPK